MIAVQLMCARLGLVTRRGLASVLRKHYPPWLLWFACSLLLVGNTINIAADLSGMAAGAELLTHVNRVWFVPVFAVVILLFLMFGSYAHAAQDLQVAHARAVRVRHRRVSREAVVE